MICRLCSSLYTSSLSSWTANFPHFSWWIPMFQHPPIPRSSLSGMTWISRLSELSSWRTSLIPSVEWLSMTMTLNGKVVCWFSAERTASLTVRIRLRTGIMTEASFKSVRRKVYGTEDRIKISANFLQMVGACLFHFNLYLTVLGST